MLKLIIQYTVYVLSELPTHLKEAISNTKYLALGAEREHKAVDCL